MSDFDLQKVLEDLEKSAKAWLDWIKEAGFADYKMSYEDFDQKNKALEEIEYETFFGGRLTIKGRWKKGATRNERVYFTISRAGQADCTVSCFEWKKAHKLIDIIADMPLFLERVKNSSEIKKRYAKEKKIEKLEEELRRLKKDE